MFTTLATSLCGKAARTALAVAVLTTAGAGQALAADDPNPGALTFTGGLDVPQVYFFRGIRQEFDPSLTLFPYGDIGIALMSGEGSLKSASINFGVWNSLQTGTSGTDGPSKRFQYEEDFYATLNLGFSGGVGIGTTFTAYTSPNSMFTTVKEIMFKVTKAHMLNPYGVVAFELGGDTSGSADLGTGGHKGTYVELGIGPSWPLAGGKVTVAVPVKVGLSAKDYFESPVDGKDNKFGFLDVGAIFTYPLAGIPAQFGAWNIHGGADFLLLGETTKVFNTHTNGDETKGQIIGLFGIGVSY